MFLKSYDKNTKKKTMELLNINGISSYKNSKNFSGIPSLFKFELSLLQLF